MELLIVLALVVLVLVVLVVKAPATTDQNTRPTTTEEFINDAVGVDLFDKD